VVVVVVLLLLLLLPLPLLPLPLPLLPPLLMRFLRLHEIGLDVQVHNNPCCEYLKKTAALRLI